MTETRTSDILYEAFYNLSATREFLSEVYQRFMRKPASRDFFLADIASAFREVENEFYGSRELDGHNCEPPYYTPGRDGFQFSCPVCKLTWIKNEGWKVLND